MAVRLRFIAAAALLLTLAGCDSPADPRDAGPPARLAIVSGDRQEAVVGTELPDPLVVRVVDADGTPVSGQLLNFRVVSGGGSVFAGSSVTNAQGIAQERWTLGTVARDTQRIEARAIDNATGQPLVFASFTAVGKPAAPAAIATVGAPEHTAPAGLPLADSVAVRVTDQYGNVVPNAAVVWRVIAGGGTVSPANGATNAQGVARALWTLGARMDTTQVLDAAAGVGLYTQLRATASTPPLVVMVPVSGDAQRGTVATQLPDPLVIAVTLPDGRNLPGATVTWTAASEAGIVTPATATADHAGRAAARWTLGTIAGPWSVSATSAGATPFTFAATAEADVPATLTKAAGDGQTGDVGTPLPQKLIARVADRYSNPLADVLVRWAVSAGGGSVHPDTARSNDNGIAQTTWTLGSISGTGTVTATIPEIASVAFSATAQAPIHISVRAPAVNSRSGDTLSVAVSATSQREVRTVSAAVEGRRVDLVFVPEPFRGDPGSWLGVIVLTGLQRGPKELVVTASDAGGNTATAIAPFVYDRLPRVVATSPLVGTVVRNSVHLAAACEDDDPTGCTITVLVEQPDGYPSNLGTVATGTGAIDAHVSLADYDGRVILLAFVARDSGGQTVRHTRTVYVESSPRWTEISSAGVRLWDINAERILYQDSAAEGISLHVLDRATKSTSLIAGAPSRLGRGASLSPRGAIFVGDWDPGVYRDERVYEWRNGSLLDLGIPIGLDALLVASSWAIWHDGTVLYRRDLIAGTTTSVAANAGGGDNDVAENGDVVYNIAGVYDIARYRSGTVTRITADDDGVARNTSPRTDGSYIVYRKAPPCCSDGDRIAVHDGTTEQVLSTRTDRIEARADENYQVNNGWIAYTKMGTGGASHQVWTRAPDGVHRQVSSFSTGSYIHTLGPNGEVVFASDRRRYLSKPPYSAPPVDIGGDWFREIYAHPRRLLWVDGQLIVLLGRSAFRID